ncbi:MAG TPA: hypothetical protein VI248_08870 [Kineosporiaceae bacterium]
MARPKSPVSKWEADRKRAVELYGQHGAIRPVAVAMGRSFGFVQERLAEARDLGEVQVNPTGWPKGRPRRQPTPAAVDRG